MAKENWETEEVLKIAKDIYDIIIQKWLTSSQVFQVLENLAGKFELPSTPHNWMSPKLRTERSELSGMGVFVKKWENIDKWELIAVFWGKVHTLEQWFNLPENLNMGHILVHPHFSIGAWSTWEIDDGDYFNHSCNPNVGIKWQVCLYALESISEDQEITFDYGTIFWGFDIEKLPWNLPEWFLDRKTGIITLFSKCNCWSYNCRWTVTSEDWKKLMKEARLRGFFPPHIQELIDNV